MGIFPIIQHELISKNMKPTFQVPEDQLTDEATLKGKPSKPLKSYLPAPSSKETVVRKDLAANWDSVF
jgi:hypothetical protein